jgi:acetyl-CoA C-acetyltransferase
MANEALIIAGVRTPIGALGGVLSTVPATELGATCVRALVERAKVPLDEIDEVIMGNVVGAGLGQNPARQAAIKAGLPPSVDCTTINKVCGSGLKAVMLAAQSINLGESNAVIAGGMENMSLTPYLMPQARAGYRMGHGTLVDAMIHDGLWDVYGDKHMGIYGDQCAAKCSFSKQDQDDFAVRSYTRARKAVAEGVFDDEIVAVEIKSKKGNTVVSNDESPARFNEDKLRALKPAFGSDGTVTAGNASSINDGAAALLVVSDAKCAKLRLKPIARIVGAATFSREPEWFTLAPIGAIRQLLDKVNWPTDSVDLFEINEAFSAVTMAAEKDLKLPPEKVNIYGGAVALGHPIGASGARVLVTLLNALTRTGGTRGIASLCIGGGEAVAVAVETSFR